MNCTETQRDILAAAWATARDGNGLVLEDWAVPDAHDLVEAGWLERRFAGEQLCWFWSAAAEHALDVSALLQSADGRQN